VDCTEENSNNKTVGVSMANADNLNIGSKYSTSESYVGEIRDVTIWNKALSSAEIVTSMGTCLTGSEANIIGHYKLSEGTGTVIKDYSTFGIDGAAIQAAPSGGAWVVNNTVCRSALTMSQLINVTVNAGIADLPVTATSTNVLSGGNSDVVMTGSQLGLHYSLRDDNNVVIDGPIKGTGNDLIFNTGALTTATTFNVYGAYNNAILFTSMQDYFNLSSDNRGVDKEITIAARIKGTALNSLQNIVLDYGIDLGVVL
jgi:hypothetical protein